MKAAASSASSPSRESEYPPPSCGTLRSATKAAPASRAANKNHQRQIWELDFTGAVPPLWALELETTACRHNLIGIVVHERQQPVLQRAPVFGAHHFTRL